MRNHQNRPALRGKIRHETVRECPAPRIKGGARLIEHVYGRIERKHRCKRNAASLPPGKLKRRGIGKLPIEPYGIDGLKDPTIDLVLTERKVARSIGDFVVDRLEEKLRFWLLERQPDSAGNWMHRGSRGNICDGGVVRAGVKANGAASGETNPATSEASVDLPAPDAPVSNTTSPACSENEMSLRTARSP